MINSKYLIMPCYGFEDFQETDLTRTIPELEVETVCFESIERGIYDMKVFEMYLHHRFPNLKDLWFTQHFMDTTRNTFAELYTNLNLRSLLVSTCEHGFPDVKEDWTTVVIPADGLVILYDEDLGSTRRNCYDTVGELVFIRGIDFNPKSEWFSWCIGNLDTHEFGTSYQQLLSQCELRLNRNRSQAEFRSPEFYTHRGWF
jgi:hypothetical protein